MNVNLKNHKEYTESELKEIEENLNISEIKIYNEPIIKQFNCNMISLINVKSIDFFMVDTSPCLTVWFKNDTYKNFYDVSYISTYD